MNWTPWLVFAGVVLTVAGSYFAARFAGKSSVQTKEIEIDAAAYERAERINKSAFERLEADIKYLKSSHDTQGKDLKQLRFDLDSVTRTFRVSMNYIERFLQWAKSGSNPPIPTIPESLREHLDPSLITEHARQQQESTGPPDADPKA